MSTGLAPMRWWHLPQVHAIEIGTFPTDAWSLEQLWQELAQEARTYLVAIEGDVVVGYAGVFVMPPDADVQTVAVRADRQGRGIARQLLVSLLDDVDKRGATHTLLEVRADNAGALGLYESLGFVRIGERRRYYPDGGDALILRRAAREQDRGGA